MNSISVKISIWSQFSAVTSVIRKSKFYCKENRTTSNRLWWE